MRIADTTEAGLIDALYAVPPRDRHRVKWLMSKGTSEVLGAGDQRRRIPGVPLMLLGRPVELRDDVAGVELVVDP